MHMHAEYKSFDDKIFTMYTWPLQQEFKKQAHIINIKKLIKEHKGALETYNFVDHISLFRSHNDCKVECQGFQFGRHMSF